MLSPFIRSRSGVTLLNIALLLVLIGGLVIAGYAMMGPIIKRGKITDTKTTINSAVDAIISWSVARGHIPGTVAEFNEASVNQYDAWGRKLRYLYDVGLSTVSSTNEICSRNSTAFRINGDDIAFVVLSLGDDYTFTSSWDGYPPLNDDDSVIIHKTNKTFPDQNSASLESPDIYRTVTLNELKAKIGCFGQTGGRLQIINNELPKACTNTSYNASLYGTGGTPYIDPPSSYNWVLTSNPNASWLTPASTTTTKAASLLLGGTAPAAATSYTITATATDSQGTTVKRSYNLNVVSCDTGGGGDTDGGTGDPDDPITFNPPGTTVEDNWNGGDISDQGTNSTDDPSGKFNMTVVDGGISTISIQNGSTSSCIWYQRPLSLTGKKLRAYFTYSMIEGAGFAFALVPATPTQTTISSCDETSDLGLGSKILTTEPLKNSGLETLAGAEFKVNNITTGTGLASNCIAIILPKAQDSTCTFTTGNGTNSWQTGSTIYHVRVELDTTVTPYTYKVWLMANPDAATLTNLQNLDAAYTGGSPTPITRTLTADQIGDLSRFFLGFTAGQHGNGRITLTLNDLKFALY